MFAKRAAALVVPLILVIGGCDITGTDNDAPPVAPSSPTANRHECANPDGCIIRMRPETVKQRMLTSSDAARLMGRVIRFRDGDWRKQHHPEARKDLRDGLVPGCHYRWIKLEKPYATRIGYFSETTGRHPSRHYLWQFAFAYRPGESAMLARDAQKLFGNQCPARLSTPYRPLPGRWYQPAARHTWRQSADTIKGWKRLQGWHHVIYPTREFVDHNVTTYLQKDNLLIVVGYGDRILKRDQQTATTVVVGGTLLIELVDKLNRP